MDITFDEFLQNKFIDSHPHVHKDDLSDAYSDWEIDQDELIVYAEEYRKQEVKRIMAKFDELVAKFKE